MLSPLLGALSDSLEHELLKRWGAGSISKDDTLQVPDLFTLVRRCTLRATLGQLVASSLLVDSDDMLDDFMKFQDALEDATAKAAILPKWVSVPFFLRPVERQRQQLVERLMSRIELAWSDKSKVLGVWLREFRSQHISSRDAAELIVGLMFAVHKNVAIGSSQCLCFLESDATLQQRQEAKDEARRVWSTFESTGNITTALMLQANTLRTCVLETMRLTAHSLGAIRTAQREFTLNTESGQTYTIEMGDTIVIPHISTHLNTTVWGPDAAKFDLSRWGEYGITKQKKSIPAMASPVSEYRLTTFSHGTHKCPGERLALSLMELILVVLLQQEAQLMMNVVPSLDFERATLAQRAGPIPLTIKRQATSFRSRS